MPTIGFVVLGYAIYWAAQGQAARVSNKAAFLWSKFPNSSWASCGFPFSLPPGFFTEPADYGTRQPVPLGVLTFAGVGLENEPAPLLQSKAHGRSFLVVLRIGEVGIAALTSSA